MAQEFDFDFEREDAATREVAAKDAIASSQIYLVFEHDDRARQLLLNWKAQSKAPLPIDSPIQAYAAKETLRRFIDIIEDNINLARQAR